MSDLSSRPDAFADLEHSNWQRGVDAYDAGFGPLTVQAAPTLLRNIGFPPTSGISEERVNLLDVASGPGYVLSAAIASAKERDVGPSCSYTALDFSANFLRLAESNLSAAHPGVDIKYVEGDAQALPFEDGTFNSVVCNFGVLHLSDPDAFLSESCRVLKPGGRLSFSAWAAPLATEGFDLILSAIDKVGNPNVPLPEGPPFFRFAYVEEIITSLSDAGFNDVEIETLHDMVWDNLKSADQLYQTFLEGTARTRELLRGQTHEETEAIMAELGRSWEKVTEGGSRHLRMPAVISVGTKQV